MSASIQWYGDGFERMVREEMRKRLAVAAEGVRAEVVKSIRKSVFESRAGSNGRRFFRLVRSRPGEPPRAETGTLMKSIFYHVDPDENRAIVGTTLDYGAWLEVGTKRIKPRPYLLPALTRCFD